MTNKYLSTFLQCVTMVKFYFCTHRSSKKREWAMLLILYAELLEIQKALEILTMSEATYTMSSQFKVNLFISSLNITQHMDSESSWSGLCWGHSQPNGIWLCQHHQQGCECKSSSLLGVWLSQSLLRCLSSPPIHKQRFSSIQIAPKVSRATWLLHGLRFKAESQKSWVIFDTSSRRLYIIHLSL